MKTIAQIIGIVILLFAIDISFGTNTITLITDKIGYYLGGLLHEGSEIVFGEIIEGLIESFKDQLEVNYGF